MLKLHLEFVGTIHDRSFLLFIDKDKLIFHLKDCTAMEVQPKKLKEKLLEYLEVVYANKIKCENKLFDMYDLDKLVLAIQSCLDYREMKLDWGIDENK